MDPQIQFCPNEHCSDRGVRGGGNIRSHSSQEGRYRCTTCRGTFAATTGTAFFGLRTPAAVVTTVVTLLAHGCPPQAIVAAFGLDERTVAAWQQRAGAQCQRVHTHVVQAGQVDLQHVQADEIYVKLCMPPQPGQAENGAEQVPAAPERAAGRGRVWQAMALAVPSRLWLGGVISAHRDKQLIRTLAAQIRACALTMTVLVCVDGLSSYVGAIKHAFSERVLTGKRGRPPRVCPPGLLLAQVVKTSAKRRVVHVSRRVVLGSAAAVAQVLTTASGGRQQINTAYIERLNATFRACLAPLARRTRALAHREALLTAGMFLVGTAYNFVWCHESLRLRNQASGPKWRERTPAMAAGLTNHPWTMEELLRYQVPPAPWVAPPRPKRRGRPPKAPPSEVAA
jgi:transposase-like protein